MNGNRYTERKSRRNGFYLALAVCLVAVGIAAWSAYDAVTTYTAENQSAASRVERDEAVRDDDPQAASRGRTSPAPTLSAAPSGGASSAPKASPAPTATPLPQPTSPVTATAGEVEEAPEESAQIPANAPLYELSAQMIYPVEGQEVQKAYSAGAPVYSATMKDWRIHAGLDLAAQAGEEVRACANGQVKATLSDPMLGNVIVIEHGDYEFSYCGVGEDALVSEGDIVTKGQVIATVTAVPSESAEEPHLHLEARRDGVYLDPQAVIEGN